MNYLIEIVWKEKIFPVYRGVPSGQVVAYMKAAERLAGGTYPIRATPQAETRYVAK